MADTFAVKIDSAQLQSLYDRLDAREVPKALARALNKTLAKLRTRQAREARQTLNLPYGEIRDLITVRRANGSRPTGAVTVTRRPVPLRKFKPKQNKRGVAVTVRKGRREQIDGAFLARMPNGTVIVAVREKDATHKLRDIQGKRKIYRGLPIRQLYGPTVVTVLQGTKLEADAKWAAEDLGRQLESQVAYVLSGKRGTAPPAEDAEE